MAAKFQLHSAQLKLQKFQLTPLANGLTVTTFTGRLYSAREK